MSYPRLLVIIMHGSGRYYLEPLLSAGRLPRLDRLRAEGHQRYFRTELPIAAGAWVTLLTGQSVATHGVIDYIDRDSRAYDGMAGRMASSADYRDRTVQSILSNAGRRLASIYLPMTNPPWSVNGVMISGFPLADERRPPTYPPRARAAIATLQRASPALASLRRPGALDAYLPHNLQRIEAVTTDVCRDPQYDVDPDLSPDAGSRASLLLEVRQSGGARANLRLLRRDRRRHRAA